MCGNYYIKLVYFMIVLNFMTELFIIYYTFKITLNMFNTAIICWVLITIK